LPLCGANGVVIVPPMALWLACAAVQRWRARDPRWLRDAGVMLGLAAAGSVLAAAYFLVGYHAPGHHLAPPSFHTAAATSAKFLCAGFGPCAGEYWPYPGVVVVVGGALALAILLAAWRKAPGERLGVVGLSLFLIGVLGLAAGVGQG